MDISLESKFEIVDIDSIDDRDNKFLFKETYDENNPFTCILFIIYIYI